MNKKELIADYSFLSMFAVLPFLDFLSPVALVITILTGLFFKNQKGFFSRLKTQKAIIILFLYFLMAILSLTYSTQFDETVTKLGRIIVFVLMPIAFFIVNPSLGLIKLAKKTFIISLMFFCLFSLGKLIYHYIVDYEISHWYNFVQASMYHKYIPEDAMFLNTGLVLVLFGSFKKYFKLFCAFLFLIVIVLFGVRLGLFIYLLIVAYYFILNWKVLFSIKSAMVGIFTVLLCFFLIENSRYVNDKFYDTLDKIGLGTKDRVSETGEKYHNIFLREKMWSASIELIQNRPILGYGAGAEREELANIYKTRGYSIPRYNAHNQFLSSTVQLGFLGFFAILGVFGILLYNGVKQNNRVMNLIILVMAGSMITESYLEIQQGLFYYCIFVCLLSYWQYQKGVLIKEDNL